MKASNLSTLPGVDARFIPGREDLAALVEPILTQDTPDGAETVYRGRNALFAFTAADGTRVSAKRFRVPVWPNRLVYGRLRKSKARQSFDNSLRLKSLGFSVPEPYGLVETRRHGLFGQSIFFCRQMDGYTDCRYIKDEPDYERQARDIAALLYRLHTAGVLVLDFSPGNILRRRSADGSLDLCLIDVNRIRFGVHSRRRLYRMFGTIVETLETVKVIARAYADIAGLDPADVVPRAVDARLRFVRRCNRKAAVKKILKKLFR